MIPRTDGFLRLWVLVTPVFILLLSALLIPCWSTVHAESHIIDDDDEYRKKEADKPLEGHQIKEPFFEFVVSLAEGDSLGHWSGVRLQKQLTAADRDSRFPVELILSITRRPALPAEQHSLHGTDISRIWEFELSEALDKPMPYSILGYHPGSLRVSKTLIFSERYLGNLSLTADNQTNRVKNVRVLRLDTGKVALDADGLIDAILGAGLDDSWTLAMVLAEEESNRIAIAVSIGREGRPIYGEIDLVRDKVLAHGRPLAGALSRACRPWAQPVDKGPLLLWQDK